MAKKIRADARRLRGAPIAIKFTLVMAGLIAVFMSAFGVLLHPYISREVTRQIKLAAHEAAYTAAQADVAAWTEFFDTEFQGLSRDEVATLVGAMSGSEYAARYDSEEVKQTREWNRLRWNRALLDRTRIVAAEVLDTKVSPPRLIASSHGKPSEFAPFADDLPVALERGTSTEGRLTIEGQQRPVIRGSYPLEDRQGQTVGEVVVYIAAGAIDEATSTLAMRIFLVAMAFIFVGSGVTWIVGARLMKPIKQLQDDLRIVAGGDLDHRTKSRSSDEIGELARSFDEMTQSLAEARKQERDTAASRHQMGVAGEVAESLFPTALPELPGYDLAGHHEASGQLGGEYYDVIPMPKGRYALLVGAASGSGVPAAIVMAMARSFLAALTRHATDPGAVLREVNALLSGDLRRGMYVSMLMVVLDPEDGTLTIANAGHSPLLFVKAEGKGIKPLQSEGIALGFDKGPVFDRTLKVVRVRIGEGDRVVLYTPGITQVIGAKGEALGEDRFAGLVKREAHHDAARFAKRIAATLKKFRGDEPLSEDVTLLTLGRLAGGGGGAGGEGGAE